MQGYTKREHWEFIKAYIIKKYGNKDQRKNELQKATNDIRKLFCRSENYEYPGFS